MPLFRLFTGSDGKSHIEPIPLAKTPEWGKGLATTQISFRESPAGHFQDWHPAPRRQFVIILSGQLEIGSDAARGDEPEVSWLIVEDGGHAGIECSVGGSGGHTSVSSGIAPWAGATSSREAPVVRSGGVCGPPAGGHVPLEVVAGRSGSSRGSPGGAGTV